MRTAAEVLSGGIAAGFLYLGVLSAREYGRRKQIQDLLLTAALVLIGVVAAAGIVNRETEYQYRALSYVALGAFLLSGYLLLMFRHAFIPISKWAWAAVTVLLLAAGGAYVAIGPPIRPNVRLTTPESLVTLGLVAVWGFCIVEPIVRFWRASSGRPVVQRARLRSLAVGYGGIVIAVLVALAGRLGDHPAYGLVGNAAVLALVPVLQASFAPPRWLKRAWREREGESYRLVENLTAIGLDHTEIAERALRFGLRIVGADSGFIADQHGEVLSAHALDEGEIARIAELQGDAVEGFARMSNRSRAFFVPLKSGGRDRGVLCLVPGPFTPVFGDDEISRITDYADLIAVALERAGLVEALQGETELYEALLQAVSDLGQGFVITDAGRLVYANEAYLSMTGYTLEELKALPSLLDLSPVEERDQITERMRTRLQGGEVADSYEASLIHKDGSTRYVEAAVKLIHTDDGLRIISIVRDITARKRDEETLQRTTRAVELLRTVAVAANEADSSRHALTVALDEICAYTGWPIGHVYLPDPEFSDELLPTDLWHLGDLRAFSRFKDITERTRLASGKGLPGRVYASGKPEWVPDVTVDTNFPRNREGSLGVRGAFASPILAGNEVVGVLEFFSEEIEPPNHDLLAVVTQIGTQLGRVMERERIEQFRDRFIANAAHELRTPVTSLVGFANLLVGSRERLSKKDLETATAGLDRQASRLYLLVNNLLDFTRIQQERANLDLQEWPLRPVLEEIAATTPSPEGKTVKVQAQDLGVVADRLRLEQIMVNLLTNAYRYGGDSIVIEAVPAGDWVEVSVSDDGEGVPEEVVPQLFVPFTRGKDSARVGGSGLGLAIVRMLARAQGGDVRYEPTAGRGAAFVVRLRAPK